MLKRIHLVFILLGILTMFSACSKINGSDSIQKDKNTKFSSEIVKAGNNNITAIVKSSNINEYNDLETEIFQSIMKEKDITIPYIKLGETIQINTGNEDNNTYQLKDYILNEDGTLKYEKKTIKSTEIKFDKGVGSFVLNENLWANLSSNSADYEPGKSIRGFHLMYKDKKEEYAFIVRTDAVAKK